MENYLCQNSNFRIMIPKKKIANASRPSAIGEGHLTIWLLGEIK